MADPVFLVGWGGHPTYLFLDFLETKENLFGGGAALHCILYLYLSEPYTVITFTPDMTGLSFHSFQFECFYIYSDVDHNYILFVTTFHFFTLLKVAPHAVCTHLQWSTHANCSHNPQDKSGLK